MELNFNTRGPFYSNVTKVYGRFLQCLFRALYISGDTQLRPRRKWRDAVLGVRHGRRRDDKKLESARIKLQTVTSGTE